MIANKVEFPASSSAVLEKRLAVLKEAVERADSLAATQERLINNQAQYISLQEAVVDLMKKRVHELESEASELRCAVKSL